MIPETIPAAPGTFIPVNSSDRRAEPIIVDTGNELSRQQWLEAAFSVVEPDDVRWVFLSHDDHDHVGNLLTVLEACPDATLVTNLVHGERLSRSLELPLERMRWGQPRGDLRRRRPHVGGQGPAHLGLADRPRALRPHHRVYWAVDAFASLLPGHVTETDDVPGDLWRDSFLSMNATLAPWHTLLDPAKFDRHVDSLAALGITTIASAHSAILRGGRLDDASV